jgi:hypothetical protein
MTRNAVDRRDFRQVMWHNSRITGRWNWINEMATPKPKASSDPTSDLYPYELEFFMEKHGLSKDAAEVILHTNGPSRHRCDYAAEAFLQSRRLREARQKPPAPSIKGA